MDNNSIANEVLATELEDDTIFIKFETTARIERENVIRQYNLNEKQRLVLRIVCDQALGESRIEEQLILGVFGEGGTGKAQVINAIRDWFQRTGRKAQLLVTATTGTAAARQLHLGS